MSAASLFVLVDGAHPMVRSRARLMEADLHVHELYKGTLESAHSATGPLLLADDPRRYLRHFVEREYVERGVPFARLTTTLSAEKVSAHLKRCMYVRTSRGDNALLRLWDISVFRRLTYVLTAEQFVTLTGPFMGWETVGPDAVRCERKVDELSEDASESTALTLTDRQVAMLALPLAQDIAPRIAKEIIRKRPRRRPKRKPADVNSAVHVAYRYALEHLRLSDLRTVVAWVRADAGWAVDLRRLHPVVHRISKSRHADLSVEDLLCALKAATRFAGVR